MFQSLKKLLFVCSLILSSCVVPIYAESENPLVYDQTQGKFQDFLNKQSGDVKVVMEKRFTETISIPDTITSLEIDLAGHSISGTMYANGIPLTISNGHTGRIYGGSYNADVETGTMITLNNVRIDGDLYGGGYADSTNATANVTGGSILILNNVETLREVENGQGVGDAHDIYGGGHAVKGSATVDTTNVSFNGGLIYSIYGGGHAENGSADILNTSQLSVVNASSYGNVAGCSYLKGTNPIASCGNVKLNVEDTYFPVSERIFGGLQSGNIIGGSYSEGNGLGKVEGNVFIQVIDTQIYAEIIGGAVSFGTSGDFSVGSVDILLKGVKTFNEPHLNIDLTNEIVCLGGALNNADVLGDIHAVIKDCDLGYLIISERNSTANGTTTLEFEDGGVIAGFEGINKLVLGAPLKLTDNDLGDNFKPVEIKLKGNWKNGVKALTIDGFNEGAEYEGLFYGDNLIYGADETAPYWMTDGLVETPTIEPEPDHSSSNSGGSTSSTIVKGETETTVKVDDKTGSLSSSVVKKLVQENEKVAVVIENSDMKITYPKGALGDLTGALSVNVTVDGKDEITKKAAEKAGEAVMTFNFKEEKMFSAQQSVKIEIKTDTELVGKTLYYQKYDDETNQLVLVMPTVVNEEGWLEVSQLEAGCYVLSETIDPYWHKTVTGDWYYFDEQGQTVTGWLADNSDWYYLEEKGTMHKGWLSLDDTWYCMNDAGKLIKGWNPQGSIWYYHDGTGSLVKNQWIWDEGGWYYIDHTGSMLRDGYTPDGFHVNQSGVYDY